MRASLKESSSVAPVFLQRSSSQEVILSLSAVPVMLPVEKLYEGWRKWLMEKMSLAVFLLLACEVLIASGTLFFFFLVTRQNSEIMQEA